MAIASPAQRAYVRKMDFLMSGESEVLATIAALDKKGYESNPVKFNSENDGQALTWLAITERLPADVADITATVRRVDPRAIRI